MHNQQDPDGQLQWLVDTLTEAEKNTEIVHILTHVPSNDQQVHKNWGREFRKIIERFYKVSFCYAPVTTELVSFSDFPAS